MRCMYCDGLKDKIRFTDLFLEDDVLCWQCRERLKLNRKYVDIGPIKVETLYDYDCIFKELLIQYKECFDEALAPAFLYLLNEYLTIKYRGYQIIFIPSSKQKLSQRGFNHLDLIFKDVKLKRNYGLKMKDELIQEDKNYNERRLMVSNYYYDGPILDRVLIVDDVLTTGSSMLGAYLSIKPYSRKIKALALSRKRFHLQK